MPKNSIKSNKKARRELARKKARQKKLLIIAAVVVIVLAVAAVVIFGAVQDAGTQIFSQPPQTVRLLPNRTFTAELYHGIRHSGTYTKTEQDGLTTIEFNSGGVTAQTVIIDDNLFVPLEWQDDHGHNTVLPKR